LILHRNDVDLFPISITIKNKKYDSKITRKLLSAIPDSALDYKPSEKNWTTGQLASHIAEVYNWYQPTLHENVMDMAAYKYDKGDISKAANIVAKFEENLKNARQALETVSEEKMFETWKMVMGSEDNVIFPEMPRVQVTRSFLFNHLYHHRGEMVVYLRATGNKVPGLYGPTADGNM
jgi:uncharacterized damage-inducible protein DinB